jgi:DNA-binding NarL/FixJ family response regulator
VAGPVRILIADNHEAVRRMLRAVLEDHEALAVCGEAATGQEVMAKAVRTRPDFVVLGVDLRDVNALDLTRELRRLAAPVNVVALTMDEPRPLAKYLYRAGARVVLSKADAGAALVDAITYLVRGAQSAAERRTDDPGRVAVDPQAELTPRERDIVRWLAEGRSNKEIAAMFSISVKTVETHRAKIMRKLELSSITQLVRHAIRQGIITA